MKLQLRQRLTVGEFVVPNNEIALLVVRPVGIIRLGERGRGDADESCGNDDADHHGQCLSRKICVRSV